MRKGFDGLTLLVQEVLKSDPFSGHLFIFRGKRAGMVKILHQAPVPERVLAGGLATPGLIAHVLVSRYCDHLPLYRQSQIFARHGAEISRSTLSDD
jgi:transposase